MAIPRETVPTGNKKAAKALAKKVPTAPVDWSAMLGQYGLPAPVVNELNRVFQQTGDLQQAITIGLAYVRGTGWYKQTYPGIQAGISKGLFTDERGYREYKNQIDQLYRQHYKRAVTPAEVAKFVKAGKDAGQVAREFTATAIRGALTDPLRQWFTSSELAAYSNQEAGITSEAGLRIQAEANLASQVDQLYKDFHGRGVTREELNQLFKSGATPEQVARNFATQANINAMNPAVSHLFTPEEIQQIALDRAGGITANGQVLAQQASLAAQLNPIYHQYTGQGVSRQDVEAAYQSGEDVATIGKRFAGKAYVDANRGDIQQAFGNFGGEGQLDEAGLKALGEQQVGLDSALGQKLDAALVKAQRRMQTVSRGVLARMNTALASTSQRRPDVGA